MTMIVIGMSRRSYDYMRQRLFLAPVISATIIRARQAGIHWDRRRRGVVDNPI